MTVHEFRRAELDKIADQCGLPRTTFHLVGDDELQLKPDPNAPYPSVDCAIRRINESDIPFKLGFVGNEAYIGNGA